MAAFLTLVSVRITWLKKLGISYKQMEEDGVMLPVIELKINFKQPASFDDKLILTTRLKSMPSYMIEFDFEIKRDDQIITIGYTKLVFLNTKINKPMRCPESILKRLPRFHNNNNIISYTFFY